MSRSSVDFLPYPLPPWEHDFCTLAVHCEIKKDSLVPFIPFPFELVSNYIQVAVMKFNCQVPERLYYDAAVIAKVRYGSITGGFWPFAYNSTDQAMSGTREIWGYNMKLADMNIDEQENHVIGVTNRLGKKIIDISMVITGEEFEKVDMFPRLFIKRITDSQAEEGVRQTIVKMDTRPEVQSYSVGQGKVELGASTDDPLHELNIINVFGATLTKGHQVLPWGEELK